jgi:hypothetical protein
MTRLMEKALAEISKLREADQDAIAAIILDEIADERRWDESFSRSQDELSKIAERVREDIRAGKVKDVGIDEL